ncbi:MAG: DNA polymerase III subunit chi [Myxococcota bacterium]|nr:DNA polymerase III subunit chi [Myxococcota bacterium]
MTNRVVFYDVPPDSRSGQIVRLAEAAWQREKKLLIYCGSHESAQAVDQHLWTASDTSFLPHEVVPPGSGPKDAMARIVIVTAEEDPIGADLLLLLDPASMTFASEFDVVMDWVDHRSPELLAQSRERFRLWRENGITPEHVKSS